MAENSTTKMWKAFSQLSTGANKSELLRSALFQQLAEAAQELHSGWTDPTGTEYKGAWDADDSTTVAGPTIAEVQAINDRLKQTRQILKAVVDALLGA